MSKVFQRVASELGLTATSQGDGYRESLLFVLLTALQVAEDANPTADTYTNIVQELEYRLSAYANTSAMKQFVKPLLNRMNERLMTGRN